jgi:hypothetical protein
MEFDNPLNYSTIVSFFQSLQKDFGKNVTGRFGEASETSGQRKARRSDSSVGL